MEMNGSRSGAGPLGFGGVKLWVSKVQGREGKTEGNANSWWEIRQCAENLPTRGQARIGLEGISHNAERMKNAFGSFRPTYHETRAFLF